MKKTTFTEALRSRRLYFDGGTGTVFQKQGLSAGTPPESLNLSDPQAVVALHRAYLAAGCDIIKSNTFGIHRLKYDNYEELIRAALACAKEAQKDYPESYLAFDIGPLGRLLEPLGTLPFEEAVSVYADSLRLAEECGCDLILIETMNDSYETKAAVLAAKEVTSLPVVVTNAYDESGKLMTGATPEAMTALLEGLGVAALGCNCSFGPDKMLPIAERLLACASIPVVMNPNAGLPSVMDSRTVYSVDAPTFAASMKELAELGVTVLGGCCGTDPSYLAATIEATKELPFVPPTEKELTVVSSYTHAVTIGCDPVLIGERINPTGKAKLKEALRNGDMSYLLGEAVRQTDAGAHILDVNVGLPELDEPSVMAEAISQIQAVTDLPLQIDSSNPAAIEKAMRRYNGKPMINSVTADPNKLAAVLPLVKKYGGVVVALTMDENGIPSSSEERAALAKRIEERAAAYGIQKKNLVIDPLALSISSDSRSAAVTLGAVRSITEAGFRTVLGVSNISFGLPKREKINAAFLASALENGLSAAIVNPFATGMTDVYHAFRALKGYDTACRDYIAYADRDTVEKSEMPLTETPSLRYDVTRGMTDDALSAVRELLKTKAPLAIIDEEIVPALNEIGEAFEKKKAYLPQLLMSAETASAAFAEIKKALPKGEGDSSRRVLLATVKGDIHDIGKNIVKVLLESYGFTVIDLGRDVPPETVRDEALKQRCRLVGLSALMTTTVPAMEETIRLLKEADPAIRVMVGGAVLTKEYADRIGADDYAPDAMGAVRCAEAFDFQN